MKFMIELNEIFRLNNYEYHATLSSQPRYEISLDVLGPHDNLYCTVIPYYGITYQMTHKWPISPCNPLGRN